MGRPCLLSSCLVAGLCLASIGASQQSAAQYGQRQEKGVGAGGRGYAGAPRSPAPKISQLNRFAKDDSAEAESSGRQNKTRTAILSVGAFVDTKVELKAGDTVIAAATSDAFDSALAVVGPGGKQVAANEDRDEGEQSPLLIYRCDEPGTYLLRVLSAQPGAGGRFEMTYRSFASHRAHLGEKELEIPARDPESHEPLTLRLDLTKGKIYDLRPISASYAKFMDSRNAMTTDAARIIGPTGVPSRDFECLAESGLSGGLILAKSSGEFYLEYQAATPAHCKTEFAEVQAEGIGRDESKTYELKDREARVIEFDVTAGQTLTTAYSGPTPPPVFAVTRVVEGRPVTEFEPGGESDYGSTDTHVFFRSNAYSSAETLRVFRLAGHVRLVLRGSKSFPKLGIKNSSHLTAWEAGKPLEGSLGIADARVYSFKASQSELVRVAASAKSFEPKMEVFTMDGELANTLINRRTHRPGDDLYFPAAGNFLVRFSCDGNGGSGDYDLRRTSLEAKPYALGSAGSTSLDPNTYGLFAVSLEAGKRYELLTERAGWALSVDLLDAEGAFLRSQDLVFGKTHASYFVPLKSGVHRLWLRGETANQKFVLRPHNEPTIGG